MRTRSAIKLTPLLLAILGVCTPARAQGGYDPTGISLGTLQVFPELELGVEYTDNALSTDIAEDTDTIFRALPSIEVRTDWALHALSARVEAPQNWYAEFDEQNTSEVSANVDGRLDLGRATSLGGSVRFSDLEEPLRASPNLALVAEPVAHQFSSAGLAFDTTFNRLSMSISASLLVDDYEDSVDALGAPVDQDERDRKEVSYGGRLEYSVTPDTGLYVSVGRRATEFEHSPINKDSTGVEALVGVSFGVNAVLTGHAGIGYTQLDFDDPSLDTTSALAVGVELVWRPDSLVTVNIAAERALQGSDTLGVVSYVGNSANVEVKYAFRRNIDINFSASYAFNEFSGSTDDQTTSDFGAQVDYKMNGAASIFFRARHSDQNSSGFALGQGYEANSVAIGVRLRR